VTKAQFRKKYRSLVRKIAAEMNAFGEAALGSGAVELEDYRDDYELPKNVACAAMQRFAGEAGYGTGTRKHKNTVKNLHRCVPLL
jgi:hypothetical protein